MVREWLTPSTSARSSALTLRQLQGGPRELWNPKSPAAQSPRGPSPRSPYLTILNDYFKPEKLTKKENRVKGRTIVALKELTKERKEALSRQKLLLHEYRQLHDEKDQVQAENKAFVAYLDEKNEQCRRKHEELWMDYFRQCRDIEQRRQALTSRLNQRNADLKAQLLQGRKTQSDIKRQLRALEDISLLKEIQDMKIETLRKEKEKVLFETPIKDQDAHFYFMREKKLLEKQLNELEVMELEESQTRELRKKAKALELTAKKAHVEFCRGINKENYQIREELHQLTQEYKKVEATRNWLERQKQHLKEEQWYQEALIKGRQLLQALREHPPAPKEQVAAKVTQSRPFRPQTKINTK